MSIPLVRNNTKDAINTSIIAIKKNLERINSLLGLADSSEPDLSGLATKQELEDAVTEINNTIDEVETFLQPVDAVTSGNMQSVTSGAVANALSYSTSEMLIGGRWIDGKRLYRKVITYDYVAGSSLSFFLSNVVNSYQLISNVEVFTSLFNNRRYQFFSDGDWTEDWGIHFFHLERNLSVELESGFSNYSFTLYFIIDYIET